MINLNEALLINDTLICERPLPLPEDEEELTSLDYNWEEHEWILKKIEMLEPTVEYEIGDNGFLYKRKITNEEKELYELEQQDVTRELEFFGFYEGKDHDYMLNYIALFYKGELKELNLDDFEKVDNTKRLKFQKDALNLYNKQRKDLNVWWYKYFVKPIKSIFAFIIRILFIVTHFIAVGLYKALLKVDETEA